MYYIQQSIYQVIDLKNSLFRVHLRCNGYKTQIQVNVFFYIIDISYIITEIYFVQQNDFRV